MSTGNNLERRTCLLLATCNEAANLEQLLPAIEALQKSQIRSVGYSFPVEVLYCLFRSGFRLVEVLIVTQNGAKGKVRCVRR